jgi:hypothetical protein
VVPTAAECVRYWQEKSWYPFHFWDVVLLELLDPAHLSLGEWSARLQKGRQWFVVPTEAIVRQSVQEVPPLLCGSPYEAPKLLLAHCIILLSWRELA